MQLSDVACEDPGSILLDPSSILLGTTNHPVLCSQMINFVLESTEGKTTEAKTRDQEVLALPPPTTARWNRTLPSKK